MKVRKARKEDCAKITEQLWVPFMDYCSKLDDFSRICGKARSIFYRHLCDSFTDNQNAVFIAEEGKNLAGFIKISKVKRPPVYEIKEMGEISDLFVLPQYREKGAGSKLLKTAEDWFKSNKLGLVWLKVHSTNDLGKDFWIKKGFEDYMIERMKKL